MVTNITPRLRVLRGVSAAVIITLLAVASHETGGGNVSLVAALLAFTASTLTCVMLAGRVLTTFRACVAVAVGQGLYHALFAAFPASSDGMAGVPAVIERTGSHGEHPFLASSAPFELLPVASSAHHVGSHGDLMWVAHVLAAALALIVVLRGEEAWWQVIHVLGLFIRRLVLHVVIFLGHAAPTEAHSSAHLPILTSVRFVVQAPTRRGPPAAFSTTTA